ncbi:MAG: AAA family ATPase, partial [Candidatus Dormibacteria bacterium]
MLAELRIENLAVIEGTEAHFAPGLNALTGESGAGKSVLLAALGLALGGRAEVGLVRRGQERARVAAAFSDPGAAVSQLSSDLGLGAEEALVLQREVAATGRSVSRANGALVAASALAQLGERLVELQGQGATSAWLRESQQRAGLDSLDRPQSLEDLELIQSGWGRRERLLRDLADLEQRRERMAAELELARLDLAELEAAQLQDGEDERLVRERELLRHSQGLRGAGDRLRLALAGDGELEGAAGLLGGALQDAGRQRGLDPALDRLLDEAERSASELQELRLAASAYLDQISEDPGRLEQVEERLELLDRLARRHGGT